MAGTREAVRDAGWMLDFLNGFVAAAAERTGSSAPVSVALTRMIHGIEDGVRRITPENIEELWAVAVPREVAGGVGA